MTTLINRLLAVVTHIARLLRGPIPPPARRQSQEHLQFFAGRPATARRKRNDYRDRT